MFLEANNTFYKKLAVSIRKAIAVSVGKFSAQKQERTALLIYLKTN